MKWAVSTGAGVFPRVRTVTRGVACEHCLTIPAAVGAFFPSFDDAGRALEPLSSLVFGGDEANGQLAHLSQATGAPVTWVQSQGPSERREPWSQVTAVSGAAVRSIRLEGRLIGRTYADDDAEYCYLGGLLPQDLHQPRARQARSCFEQMERALAAAGMDFTHIVRTWLYLDRILEWYDAFNEARTQFFAERGVLGKVIPASTGIGAENPAGAAMVAGVLAVKPKPGGARVHAVPSPLQCSAVNYRSTFSRATEVTRTRLRQLYISGTASIAPDGQSVHQGDVVSQIDLTMTVIHALLRSRQMDWPDTTRLTAYFRNIDDLEHFEAWCAQRDLLDLPTVALESTVCRDDLLFEAELDAASTRPWRDCGAGKDVSCD